MDTKAIEKFSTEARKQLLKDVEQQLYFYALDDAGRAEYDAEADAIRGVVLSPTERAQRVELFQRIEQTGTYPFIATTAYTWFNRFSAIRYMELHGYLPNHVRMLSATDGSFNPECLRVAATLDLLDLNQAEVAKLIQAGDDEGLYRTVLIAQCNQLATFLPSVFGSVTADALTLPQNLLGKTEFNVLYRLVTDIPEDTWQDVEILGWMYQFYNKELKDEFFKSKRKANAQDLAPATQLFTPEWIVRYMVDNSLGRLWMLNHPDSNLTERAQAENPADRLMEYYIAPDKEHEDFIRVASPEDITFCDPACGSGHILIYAFKMLMAIYEECGYRTRDIPGLILKKNLSGMEIDPRAAQIATLALAMCAREHDRRFFDRNIKADIRVLHDVPIDTDALVLTSPLRQKPKLMEVLAHLDEIGSLFAPTSDDIAALEGDLRESAADNLFAAKANENINVALELCKALSRRFDVVVANPPYMGSSSFNPFMSKWMKKHYPDSCKDLCTAFIERGYTLARDNGYAAMVAMQSWMFLGSFEKMRGRIIDEKTILTMAHLGTRAFDAIGGEVVSVTADVLYNSKTATKGAYFRLVDIAGGEPKRKKLLEAIQNPDCGYFYRADATTFHDIPGSPIAYWASGAVHEAFRNMQRLGDFASPSAGITTGNNERYIHFWWELEIKSIDLCCFDICNIAATTKWYPCNKGGQFRKWYGNRENVMRFDKDTQREMSKLAGYRPVNLDKQFRSSISWSDITSGGNSFRRNGKHNLYDHVGISAFPPTGSESYVCALLNSHVVEWLLKLIAPTIHCNAGDVAKLPISNVKSHTVDSISDNSTLLSKADWDSQETSWDFVRNPLI